MAPMTISQATTNHDNHPNDECFNLHLAECKHVITLRCHQHTTIQIHSWHVAAQELQVWAVAHHDAIGECINS
jgi:hypothetical protein